MKLCYNGELLEKTLPEKMSKLFEKTKVLKFDSVKECFILDSYLKIDIIEAAIHFYEASKPFSDEDLALFIKYKKELNLLSISLKLPSLQNFTLSQLKPQSFKRVSTEIEDDIIVFGEQNFNHYYTYKKSHFPTFPTFKFGFKTKVDASGGDKFMQLYKNYQNLQKQIDNLEKDLQIISSEQLSDEPTDKLNLRSNKLKKSTKSNKEIKQKQQKSDEDSKLSENNDNNENEDDKLTTTSNSLDKYVLSIYKDLKFKESHISGVTYAYSSSFNDDCGNVDILANTDGWFYQSEDTENQFAMFKFSKPIMIDYYFIMTYALPEGFSHLKKWRLATLEKNDDKEFVIVNMDKRETMELNGTNKMGGYQVNYNRPVDNVFIQMIGNNVYDNYRLTLQNIFFSSNPPLNCDSPFYSQ